MATSQLLTPSSVSSSTAGSDLFAAERLIDNSGLTGPVDLANFRLATHAAASPETSWVTDAPGGGDSDYYGFRPAPVLTFQLDTIYELTDLVVWGYHFGVPNNNEARQFQLEFSSDGGVSFPRSTTVEHPRIAAGVNRIALGDTFQADTVRVRVTDNFFGAAGALGGDRVGLGEVKFVGTLAHELIVTTHVDELDANPQRDLSDLSLREAIAIANATPGADVISFDPLALATPANFSVLETLQVSQEIVITDSVTIVGLSAAAITLDAGGSGRIIQVADSQAHVTLTGMTLTGGNISGNGSAILNRGRLTLDSVAVRGNTATGAGAIHNVGGSTFELLQSEVSDNQATGGGVISGESGSELYLRNTTVSGNLGAGIITASSTGNGVLEIHSSTIAFNATTAVSAGAISAGAPLEIVMHNSIVAGNGLNANPQLVIAEIAGLIHPEGSHNLLANPTGVQGLTHGFHGNQIGDGSGDRINPTSVLVPSLANHGGGTRTHRLVSGSSAEEAGYASYGEQVRRDGPLAWWRLDEEAGSRAADARGLLPGRYTDAGTRLGQLGIVPEQAFGAVRFEGSGSGISVTPAGAAIPDHLPRSAISVEAWVFGNTQRDSVIAVANFSESAAKGWELTTESGGIGFRLATDTNGGELTEILAPAPANQWHHVVATYDGRNVRLFINGLLLAEAPAQGTIVYADATEDHTGVALGMSQQAASPRRLEGVLDEVAIYGQALSNAVIQRHAQTSRIAEQRGSRFPRVFGDRIDIGAYEQQPIDGLRLIVTTTDDEQDPDPLSTPGGLADLSLREAIEIANRFPGLKQIEFDPNMPQPARFELTEGQLIVTEPLDLIGLGASRTIIDAGGRSQIFTTDAADLGVTIQGVTLTGGGGFASGGAIRNLGVLQVRDSAISDNEAFPGSAAIANFGQLTVTNSTVSGTFTLLGDTAAIANLATNDPSVTPTLGIYNSTISSNGNLSDAVDGVRNLAGQLTVVSSTIATNFGIGLRDDTATAILANTIVAGNRLADVSAPIDAAASAHNVIQSAASSGGLSNGVNGNQVGVDPQLGPLADNGGMLRTHAIPETSPARDEGNARLVRAADSQPILHDQRGPLFARQFGDQVDVGAFEFQTFTAPIAVSSTRDVVDGDYRDGEVSLREAIGLANRVPGADTIVLRHGLHSLNQGVLSITDDVTLVGGRVYSLVLEGDAASNFQRADVRISAGNNHGILEIAADTNVTVQGIGFTGGAAQDGGAIHNRGQLVVTDSAFQQNVASRDGGAIYNEGSLNLRNVDLTSNQAAQGRGGAIYSARFAEIADSFVGRNRAREGGGVAEDGLTMNITDSRIEGNRADEAGGGILVAGTLATTIDRSRIGENRVGAGSVDVPTGGGIAALAPVTIRDTTIDRNTAVGQQAAEGGGIYIHRHDVADDPLQVRIERSTINDNQVDSVFAGQGLNRGGGIFVGDATVTVLNSTVSQNEAVQGTGGGVFVSPASTVTMVANTVTQNLSPSVAGVFVDNGDLTLVNNIVSFNRRTEQSQFGDDLGARSNATSFANTAFNNFLGDSVICAVFDSCSANNLGINSAFNLRGVRPLLGALLDNGGPTLTHKPQPGSPVIGVATDQVTLFVDQTGRPVVGRRDMGSTESDVTTVPTGVTTFTSAWEASAIGKSQFDAGNDAGIIGVGFDDGQPDLDGDGKSDLSGVEKKPKFFGIDINPAPFTIGGIATGPFGDRWGAEITADIDARLGVEVGYYLNSGSVDIDYDGLLEFNVQPSINPTDPIRINTSLAVTDGQLYTISPRFGGYVDLVIDIGADIAATGCAVVCTSIDPERFELEKKIPLLSANRPLAGDDRPDDATGPGDLLDGQIQFAGSPFLVAFKEAQQAIKGAITDATSGGSAAQLQQANEDLRRAEIELQRASDAAEKATTEAERTAAGLDANSAKAAIDAAKSVKSSIINSGGKQFGGGGAIITMDFEEAGKDRAADNADLLGLKANVNVGAEINVGGGVGVGVKKKVGSVTFTLPEISLTDRAVGTTVDENGTLTTGVLQASTSDFVAGSTEDNKRRVYQTAIDLGGLSAGIPLLGQFINGGATTFSAGFVELSFTTVSYNLIQTLGLTQDVNAVPVVASAGLRFNQPMVDVKVNGVSQTPVNGVYPFRPGDTLDVVPSDLTVPLDVTPEMDVDIEFRNKLGVDYSIEGLFEALKFELTVLGNEIISAGPLVSEGHPIGGFNSDQISNLLGVPLSFMDTKFEIKDVQGDGAQQTQLSPFTIAAPLAEPVVGSTPDAPIALDQVASYAGDPAGLVYVSVPLMSNNTFHREISFQNAPITQIGVATPGVRAVFGAAPFSLTPGQLLTLPSRTFILDGFDASRVRDGGTALIAVRFQAAPANLNATPINPVTLGQTLGTPTEIDVNADNVTIEQNNIVLVDQDTLMDIDGDGAISPFTDGVLAARFIQASRSGQPTAGISVQDAVGAGATRTTAASIDTYIRAQLLGGLRDRLDVDADGTLATDELLIANAMARFRVPVPGAIGAEAQRTDAGAIGDFVLGAIDHPTRTFVTQNGYNVPQQLTFGSAEDDPLGLGTLSIPAPDAVRGSSSYVPLAGSENGSELLFAISAYPEVAEAVYFLKDTPQSTDRSQWQLVGRAVEGSPLVGVLVDAGDVLSADVVQQNQDRLEIETNDGAIGKDLPVFVQLPDAEGHRIVANSNARIESIIVSSAAGGNRSLHPILDVFLPETNTWLVLRMDEPLPLAAPVRQVEIFSRRDRTAVAFGNAGSAAPTDFRVGVTLEVGDEATTITGSTLGQSPRSEVLANMDVIAVPGPAVNQFVLARQRELVVASRNGTQLPASSHDATSLVSVFGQPGIGDLLVIDSSEGAVHVPIRFEGGDGPGIDSLSVGSDGATLDLAEQISLRGIEQVDLRGFGTNAVIVDASTVAENLGTNRTLRILGTSQDRVLARNSWEPTDTKEMDGIVFDVYQDGISWMLVQQGMSVIPADAPSLSLLPHEVSQAGVPTELSDRLTASVVTNSQAGSVLLQVDRTTAGDVTLAHGILLHIHYDSTTVDLTEIRATRDSTFVNAQDDTRGVTDGDPRTDRTLSLLWFDASGAWADRPELSLADIDFQLRPGVTRPTINVTYSIGAAEQFAVSVEESADPVLIVDTLTDEDDGDFSAGDLSLREAIRRANESDLFDLIRFNLPTGGTIALTQGELVISEAVTITGPGSEQLTIDAGGNSRIFRLTRGSTNISGLSLANGVTGGNGGAILLSSSSGTFDDLVVRDSRASLGGGIAAEQAVLTLSNSSILQNTAVGGGGGIFANTSSAAILNNLTLQDNQTDSVTGRGGGLLAEGFASVRQSTIAGNQAAVGGGVHAGQVQMENSTISGNTASFDAAGLVALTGNITSSTIVLNRAGLDPGATNGIGGLDANNSVILHRSIVAGNQFGATGLPSDLADAVTASSLNVIGAADSAGGLVDGRNGNLVGLQGTGVRPLATIVALDLADNGGPTRTHALASGSPAIDVPVSYAADVLDSSPLAYYQFNGAASDAMADARFSGPAFLQPFGFPDIPGFSPSLALPAGSQLFVETDLSLNGFEQFTIEAWVNPAAAQANRTGIAGQNDLIELGFINATTIQLFTAAEGPLNVAYDSGANAGQWLYVAAVGTGSQRRIYLNGELVAEAAHPPVGPGGYGQSSDPFRFGGGGVFDAAGNFFNGLMDEVAVYSSALTSAQIQRRFALTLSNFPANDQAGNPRPLGTGVDLGALEFAPSVGPVNGDVNQDGQSNADDIDLLCRNLASGDLFFDLNSDGQVNFADIEFLVENELGSVFGDSNLDGRFDSSDLVTVFIAGQFEDGIANNSGWLQGDWNCDGDFSTADMVFVFTKGTFVSAAIPAPSIPAPLGARHAMAVDAYENWAEFRNEHKSDTDGHESPTGGAVPSSLNLLVELPAATVDRLFERDVDQDEEDDSEWQSTATGDWTEFAADSLRERSFVVDRKHLPT